MNDHSNNNKQRYSHVKFYRGKKECADLEKRIERDFKDKKKIRL